MKNFISHLLINNFKLIIQNFNNIMNFEAVQNDASIGSGGVVGRTGIERDHLAAFNLVNILSQFQQQQQLKQQQVQLEQK
jgi:hypothetical protein